MPTEPEKRTETHGEVGSNEREETEKTRIIEGKTKEKREEKREKNTGFILPDGSGVAFGTIGSDEPETIKEKTPEEKTALGGFPVVLVVAGLVVLGTIASVGWFLGKRPEPRNQPVPTVYRPTKVEAAMMRIGGVA